MDIYNRIMELDNSNKLPYPTRSVYADAADYKIASDYYKKVEKDRHQKLQDLISEYHGIQNHPAKDIIWDQAYDRGHSAGYAEICCIMGDIIEYINKAITLCGGKYE